MIQINSKYKVLGARNIRYFIVTGGRGSGKSFSVNTAITALVSGEENHKVLFTRYTLTAAEKSIIPEFIEKIDSYFKNLIDIKDLIIIVTADHSTPCELKEHSIDPVPILIYGNRKDGVLHFSEKEAKNGELGLFNGVELMDKIIKLAN